MNWSFQYGSELERFCKNSGLDSPCSTTWHVQAGKCVLRVFWFCLYLQSDHFLQCLKSLPFAIWTRFLIFFVASPSSRYCFVFMSHWSFDDFFLNYWEQLFLLQTQFIPWRIPTVLDVLTAVPCGHPKCQENFCRAAVGFQTRSFMEVVGFLLFSEPSIYGLTVLQMTLWFFLRCIRDMHFSSLW